MKTIPFNKPCFTGNEEIYVLDAMRSNKISGDGVYAKKCQKWFEKQLGCQKVLLTPSCTHALEMAAILIDIKPGDEVIMPSYTFVSTANAFVLRGSRIVFVDIRPDTMNINEQLIEEVITDRTKAIVVVHYAGVSCDMDAIMGIANKYGIFVIEDAAQGMMSTYKDKFLGTIGHLGTYSFHETKNYTSGGEGGLLIINDNKFIERSEIIREKGTNRSLYFRGMVDKYSWVDIGSSYLPSELQSAYLWGQLEKAAQIGNVRMDIWRRYYNAFLELEKNKLELPCITENCVHNAHMFYIKVKDLQSRTKFIEYLNSKGIMAVFHYVPLHSSSAGRKYGEFFGTDKYTTLESERLVRLPLFFNLMPEEIEAIIDVIKEYFEGRFDK